jgi:hypothetical protein
MDESHRQGAAPQPNVPSLVANEAPGQGASVLPGLARYHTRVANQRRDNLQQTLPAGWSIALVESGLKT